MRRHRRLLGGVAALSLLLLVGSTTSAATPRKVALKVSIVGKGSVRVGTQKFVCSTTCTRTFLLRAGSRVALTANGVAAWKFGGWGGACRGGAPRCSVRLRRATSVRAAFIRPGARTNPIPLGQTAAVGDDWRLSVVSATSNANDQILAVGLGNRPPSPGAQYFMATVSATYTGGGKANIANLMYSIGAVGSHDASYDTVDDWCGYLPEPRLPQYGDVFSGQSVSGNICFEIASNDADTLQLLVRRYPSETWFALR